MSDEKLSGLLPGQHTGKAIDAVSSVELNDVQEAHLYFKLAKSDLQNVQLWKQFAGEFSAQFQLVDKEGMNVNRIPERGDYLRIDIPGPGSQAGDGFDWVRIEEIDEHSTRQEEYYGFRVRPSSSPDHRLKEIAHFYDVESTSTFMVERISNSIRISIHDRNTKPNSEAGQISDRIRDVATGTAALFPFSKLQWQHLTDGILKDTRNHFIGN